MSVDCLLNGTELLSTVSYSTVHSAEFIAGLCLLINWDRSLPAWCDNFSNLVRPCKFIMMLLNLQVFRNIMKYSTGILYSTLGSCYLTQTAVLLNWSWGLGGQWFNCFQFCSNKCSKCPLRNPFGSIWCCCQSIKILLKLDHCGPLVFFFQIIF